MGTIVAFEEDLMRSRMRKKPKKAVTYAGVVLQFSADQHNDEAARELVCTTEESAAAPENLHSL